MLYELGYIVGEKGETEWEQRLRFENLLPLYISKSQMDSIRQIFYSTQHEDFLEIDEYLVNGVLFKFVRTDNLETGKLLIVKGNEKTTVEKTVKDFNLPINKPNLSEQKNLGRLIDKSNATRTFNTRETPFPKGSRLNPEKD